jgi:hypothetical protein
MRKSSSWIVYFIQSGGFGPIKIGKTRNELERRLTALQTASSHPLRILATLDDQPASRETELHLKFDHLRLKGEWFRPEQDLLDFIKYHGRAYGSTEEPIRTLKVSSGPRRDRVSLTESCEIRAILVLRRSGFSVAEILRVLKVSRATYHRRMVKLDEMPASGERRNSG